MRRSKSYQIHSEKPSDILSIIFLWLHLDWCRFCCKLFANCKYFASIFGDSKCSLEATFWNKNLSVTWPSSKTRHFKKRVFFFLGFHDWFAFTFRFFYFCHSTMFIFDLFLSNESCQPKCYQVLSGSAFFENMYFATATQSNSGPTLLEVNPSYKI